jgi:hypothetical protein
MLSMEGKSTGERLQMPNGGCPGQGMGNTEEKSGAPWVWHSILECCLCTCLGKVIVIHRHGVVQLKELDNRCLLMSCKQPLKALGFD